MSTVRRLIAPTLVGAVAFVADFLLFFFVWAELTPYLRHIQPSGRE